MTPEQKLLEALIEERAIKQHRYEAYIAGVWPTDKRWQKLDEEVGLTKVMSRPTQKPIDFHIVMIYTNTIAELDACIAKLSQ